MTPENLVEIKIEPIKLIGNLIIPKKAKAIVLFVHGSGSSHLSPRNQFVAKELQNNNLATLLFDLLTEEEEAIDIQTAHLRFDIDLLTKRLISATTWIKQNEQTKNLTIFYFGASTGAAAALKAAAFLGSQIKAVVSRGGRPDLALAELAKVKAPTLLIVGSNDADVIELNALALKELKCEKNLEIVQGATHLFEEQGKLEIVAKLASDFFLDHIQS